MEYDDPYGGNDPGPIGGTPPPTTPSPTQAGGVGTPPPWFQGSMPPFAPGQSWQTAGPQVDPQGRTWTWNPGSGAWEMATVAEPPPTTTGGPPPPTSGPDPGPSGPGNVQTAINNFPQFTPPSFTPQQGLTAPNPYTFTPFSYGDFQAPTLAEAQSRPGYLFGLKEGQDALQNSAAARGTLRGGGTLKDLFGYTNAAAEQNYGQQYNEDLTRYNTNRDNAFGTWAANNAGNAGAFNTNWGVTKDVNSTGNAANQQNYTNAFQNASGAFNPLFNAATLTFQDAYQRWLGKLNSLTNIATAGAA